MAAFALTLEQIYGAKIPLMEQRLLATRAVLQHGRQPPGEATQLMVGVHGAGARGGWREDAHCEPLASQRPRGGSDRMVPKEPNWRPG